MRARNALSIYLCVLLGGAALAAPPAPTGKVAFDRLKSLDGSWKTQGKDAVSFVTWRVIAGGTAVLETVTGADRTQVTSATVYALEGEELVATSYAAQASAHPRLLFKPQDVSRVRFEVAAGEAPKGAHLSSISLVWKAEDEVALEWTVLSQGKTTRRAVELKREYLDTLK